MEQITDIINAGLYTTLTVEKSITVADLLKQLNLTDKYFGVLINGKKADMNIVLKPTDEVVVLPNIAGG